MLIDEKFGLIMHTKAFLNRRSQNTKFIHSYQILLLVQNVYAVGNLSRFSTYVRLHSTELTTFQTYTEKIKMWEQLLPTYHEMANRISECPLSWDAVPKDRPVSLIILYGIVLVTVTTFWRLLFTKLIKQTNLTRNYIHRESKIWIDKIKKPDVTTLTSNQDDVIKIETFCEKILNKANLETDNINININTIDLTSLTNICQNCSDHDHDISQKQKQKELKLYLEQYINYNKNIFLANKLETKYIEEFWKCVTMLLVTIFGIYALYDKKFIYDSRYLFSQVPQNMPFEIEMYYYISLGYHGHRLIWQYFDTVRKDWLAKCIHHYITILLIIGSYCLGFTVIGSYVMIVHDNTDFILSFSKLVDYMKFDKLRYFGFVLLIISWYGGRMGVFMFCIILPCGIMYYDCSRFGMAKYAYCGFFGGLTILWVLHCYWGVFLFKAIQRLIKKKKITDTRSDDDDKNENENKNENESGQINKKKQN